MSRLDIRGGLPYAGAPSVSSLQIEQIKEYQGDREMLGTAEKFFIEMMEIKRADPRLKAFLFMQTFDGKVTEIQPVRGARICIGDKYVRQRALQHMTEHGFATGTMAGMCVAVRIPPSTVMATATLDMRRRQFRTHGQATTPCNAGNSRNARARCSLLRDLCRVLVIDPGSSPCVCPQIGRASCRERVSFTV